LEILERISDVGEGHVRWVAVTSVQVSIVRQVFLIEKKERETSQFSM
jgi:hypothetical protein